MNILKVYYLALAHPFLPFLSLPYTFFQGIKMTIAMDFRFHENDEAEV